MNGESLHVTTEEQRERLYTARREGSLCAACGRTLSADETVYIERFAVVGVHAASVHAPVGVECISPELLQETERKQPERCAGCGRGVYYRTTYSARHRALCARPCANRVIVARRSKRALEG